MAPFLNLKIYQLPGSFARKEAMELRARASLNREISARLKHQIRANVRRAQVLLDHKPNLGKALLFLSDAM